MMVHRFHLSWDINRVRNFRLASPYTKCPWLFTCSYFSLAPPTLPLLPTFSLFCLFSIHYSLNGQFYCDYFYPKVIDWLGSFNRNVECQLSHVVQKMGISDEAPEILKKAVQGSETRGGWKRGTRQCQSASGLPLYPPPSSFFPNKIWTGLLILWDSTLISR